MPDSKGDKKYYFPLLIELYEIHLTFGAAEISPNETEALIISKQPLGDPLLNF